MQQSEQIGELVGALAKAQGEITNPEKNREVTVKGKTKAGDPMTYKFKYATFDNIIDHVRTPLTKNGLWFTQTLQNGDGKYKLLTTLFHSSGQYLQSETPLLVSGADNQAFGSALTYMRRYALSALLGIAADDDDDGAGADKGEDDGKTPSTVKRGEKKPPVPTLEDRRKRFSQALDHAPHVEALDNLWKQGAALLEELKAAKPEDYNYLSLARDRKRNELAQKEAA